MGPPPEGVKEGISIAGNLPSSKSPNGVIAFKA